MITQSVGVPFTAKRCSPISRRRKGSLSDSECDTPDWSYSGATTHTSSDSARAISSQASSPAAWMPSSLVMRMRMLLDHLHPAHVGLQRVRHRDRAALLLIGLHDGDQRTADRDPRAVQRVHRTPDLAVPAAPARLHATRLERAAVGARGNLPISPLPRQPNLDVVGLLRREAH